MFLFINSNHLNTMNSKTPNLEIYHNSHKAKWAQRLIWTIMVVDLISLFSSYFQYGASHFSSK